MAELNGHVMRCVRDQNGNHVIQKCIECVPTGEVAFMIDSFKVRFRHCFPVSHPTTKLVLSRSITLPRKLSLTALIVLVLLQSQVVMLSAHPYGCRVIQRVLEHCQDKERVRSVMTEVLSSVCQLAQDQYGNYVVQHVLERGAPSDRTTVISAAAWLQCLSTAHLFARLSHPCLRCLSLYCRSSRS